MQPKILHLDIETAPVLAWVWSLFKPMIAIGQIEKDWHMLCWAAKWHGKKGIIKDAIWFHTGNGKFSKKAELKMVKHLWDMLDEADIVVAHNGDRFDVAKANAKFFEYGLTPPSPFKVVDTLKVARSRFKFTSNKLDYIIKLKEKGGKLKTDFDLWLDVMKGDVKQCKRMLKYNIEDVIILEEIYIDMLPWISNHPNVGAYSAKEVVQCSACGCEEVQYRGFSYTTASKFQRFLCNGCGHWGQLGRNLLPSSKRQELGRNAAK